MRKAKLQMCTQTSAGVHQQPARPHSTHAGTASITSLLLWNIPSHCRTCMLTEELNFESLRGVYDVLYHPVHHHSGENRSFAFLNFATPLIASAFYLKFNGRFLKCAREKEKLLMVIAAVQQELAANRMCYEGCKSQCRRKFRARPFKPSVDDNQVHGVETCARQLLLDMH